MQKDELLRALYDSVNRGEITKEEILSKINFVAPQKNSTTSDLRNLSVNKILYILGAAIVLIGLIIFIGQIWGDIGSLGRILVTLGSGLVLTASGAYLLKTKPTENIGPVFISMGGLLVPGGAVVTLNELSTGMNHPWYIAITFGIVFLFYVSINSYLKHVVLTLFTILNGTALIYFVVNAMLGDSFYNYGDVYAYLTMAIGLSYIFLGQSFKDGWNSRISQSLYSLGSLAFLGAAFSRIFDSILWQMAYLVIVIGGLFLSIKIRSKGVLISSTLFLVGFVSYITGKYFADSLGWPISLIALGFIFIGLGYVSININKKYIAS